MGKWVVRGLTARFLVSVAVIIAKRRTQVFFLVGNPGAEGSRNNSTVLSVKVGP
jgi:hypothetical protein